jgi:hypothetical protein
MNQLYNTYYQQLYALYQNSNTLNPYQFTTPASQTNLPITTPYAPSSIGAAVLPQQLNTASSQFVYSTPIPLVPSGVSNLAVWVGNLPPECKEEELYV